MPEHALDEPARPSGPRAAPEPAAAPAAALAGVVLRLQSSHGNRAVARLLRTRLLLRDPPDPAPPQAGEAPSCPATEGPLQGAAPPANAAAAPAAPAPTGTASLPAVQDVAEPVTFTEIPDDGRKWEDLPRDKPFGGLTEVERFAGALADEYIRRRGRKQVAADLLKELQASARKAAEAEKPAGESAKDRKQRIADAVKGLATPGETEIDTAVAEARAAKLAELQAHFDAHLAAPRAKGYKVSTIANAWMRNRVQELLVKTETYTRPQDQQRMWTNFWIEPGDKVEKDPSVGVPLTDAPGGQKSEALVDPRTIEFLKALNKRVPNAVFGTYYGHGSTGFAGRGLSIDMTLSGKDKSGTNWGAERPGGFYVRENVAALFDALDATAAELDFRFFAIYNDFAVARWANMRMTRGNVGFAGSIDASGALNYHGGGLKLHVHVDLVPPALYAADNPKLRKP